MLSVEKSSSRAMALNAPKFFISQSSVVSFLLTQPVKRLEAELLFVLLFILVQKCQTQMESSVGKRALLLYATYFRGHFTGRLPFILSPDRKGYMKNV